MIKKAFAKWFSRATYQNIPNEQLNLAFEAALEKAFRAGWNAAENSIPTK